MVQSIPAVLEFMVQSILWSLWSNLYLASIVQSIPAVLEFMVQSIPAVLELWSNLYSGVYGPIYTWSLWSNLYLASMVQSILWSLWSNLYLASMAYFIHWINSPTNIWMAWSIYKWRLWCKLYMKLMVQPIHWVYCPAPMSSHGLINTWSQSKWSSPYIESIVQPLCRVMVWLIHAVSLYSSAHTWDCIFQFIHECR